VPRLITHTVYKSHPPSFIEQDRRDHMVRTGGRTAAGNRLPGRDRRRRKEMYVDARPVLGHFLEKIHCSPAALTLLNQASRDKKMH
jgi:hypothetical protein